MDITANPVIETLIATALNPAILAIAVLVGLALSSGLVARSVEIVEDHLPVRAATGTRSPVRAHSGPGA